MTDAGRPNRLREVFDAALDAQPHERRELLTRECGEDADMLKRIEAMLIAAEGEDVFLREAPEQAGEAQTADDAARSATIRRRWLGEQPGTRIGAYKLLQLIGEGGFGSVYMAEQDQPVRRRVALKIIKLGMDTKQVIARFEAERQALAMMDHPNIARVFDAGATDSGRPYFVMELVRGDPITQYCDTHNLKTRERLALFTDVCRAVQHAHSKGVIHRDIKPSNVLVTVADGKPIPKVIDFGIAKATNVRLTEKTFFTEHRALIGTPEYMSPEQAEMSGVDIDTRSDVYALGVLLYVLLTGTTPFPSESLRGAAYAEMQRIIRETEPPKPSTRLSSMGDHLSSIAARRQIEPDKLTRLVKGDLDWIVMKAMEKDRTRRYETASSLADDVHRHLTGEAVLAAPPSAAYTLRKFVRRNRAAVVTAAAIAATLVLGLIGTSAGMIWALRAENRANLAADAARLAAEQESQAKRDAQTERRNAIDQANRADAEARRAKLAETNAEARAAELTQVAEFQASMLKDIDLALMGDRLREDILAEMDSHLARLNLNPLDAASRRESLQQTLTQLNFTNAAIASLDRNILQRALQTIDRDFASQPLVQARLLHTVADVMQSLGRNSAAKIPLERALQLRRQHLGNTHADTLDSITNYAILLHDLAAAGDSPDPAADSAHAGLLYQEAYDGYLATLGRDNPQTLTALSNLAYWHDLESAAPHNDSLPENTRSAHAAKAEQMYREVLDARRRILGPTHEHTLISVVNLGVLLRTQNKLNQAEPLYREAMEGYLATLGEEHERTLVAMHNMAFLLNRLGQTAEAENLHRRTLALRRRTLGDSHPHTLASLSALGRLLHQQKRYDDAVPLYQEILRTTRTIDGQGDDAPDTLLAMHNLASLLQEAGRFDEAGILYREIVDRKTKTLGADHAETIEARAVLDALSAQAATQPGAPPATPPN